MIDIKHKENDRNGSFSIYENQQLAGHMFYRYKEDKVIDIYETEVNEAFEGKGLATKLFDKAIEFAKSKNLKVIPSCSFVKAKLDENEDLKSLEY